MFQFSQVSQILFGFILWYSFDPTYIGFQFIEEKTG